MLIKILTFIVLVTLPMAAQRPAHHTEDGFRNPFPTFEERGFSDFLQWQIVERLQGVKPDKPDNYQFERVENDGKRLRENQSEFSVTWIGHSSLLIQIDGINILTDPIWSERCSPVQFAGPKRHVPPGVAFDDLPDIDVVIISHNHYDHLDRSTIQRLGNKPLFLVPLKIGEFLESCGIEHFEEYDWWESVSVNGVEFHCVPAQHFSNRGLSDRNKTLWSGWVVKGKERRFYFAGDTGYFPGFKEIAERLGPFDFAALPIGAYLPRWFMSPVHMDPPQSAKAFLELEAESFIPIHWGTFELADEPLDQPPKDLAKAVRELEIDPNRIIQLMHGESHFFIPPLVLENKDGAVETDRR